MVQAGNLAGLIDPHCARIVLPAPRSNPTRKTRALVGANDSSEERKVMRAMRPRVSPVTTGGWIANYVGITPADDGAAFCQGTAQQNSVGEFARTHDVNASDFGWANLERSCYGTE